MSNKKLFRQIRQLGFTDYEAKCYLALFERESLAVSEVSALAGIPRSNAYEALEKLLAKGVVVAIPGKMKKYTASDPWILKEKALENLTASTQNELEILEKKGREIEERKKVTQKNIEDIVSNLDSLYKTSRSENSPLYSMEILRDPIQVHRKIVLLHTLSKQEILVFKKPPYYFLSPGLEDEQIKVTIDAINRGVKIRRIVEPRHDEKDSKRYLERVKATEDYYEISQKTYNDIPIKFFVVDQRYSMYCIKDPVNGENAAINVVTDDRGIGMAFKLLFEAYWKKAEDYW
jgi:HTH-type transcriptional regulator, sugar sensing transcriptional regulator